MRLRATGFRWLWMWVLRQVVCMTMWRAVMVVMLAPDAMLDLHGGMVDPEFSVQLVV